MRIGALRQVVPDSLAFYFDIVCARHGVRGRAPGAGVRAAPGFAATAARAEWEIDYPIFLCPSCGTGGDVRIVAGEEFEVESIEVEEVAECTAPR